MNIKKFLEELLWGLLIILGAGSIFLTLWGILGGWLGLVPWPF